MKRALSIIISALILISCDNTQYRVECLVSGDVSDNDTLYLESYDDVISLRSRTDTAIVERGKVVFEGCITGSEIRRFSVNGKHVNFILEPGTIVINLEEGLAHGTPLNDEMSQYTLSLVDLTDKYAKEWDRVSALSDVSRDEKSELLSQIMKEAHHHEFYLSKNIVDLHRSDALGQWAFLIGIASNECVTFGIYKDELTKAGSYVAMFPPIKRETARLHAQEKTCVGAQYIDVKLKSGTVDSIDVSMSKYIRDKDLYLVDVWAAWSEPCLQCRMYIESLYKRYKSHGFEVLSIAIGTNRQEVNDVIRDFNITHNVLYDSDMAFLNSYGVKSVPFLMLIDLNGKIIAKGISPSALEHWIRTELPHEEQ